MSKAGAKRKESSSSRVSSSQGQASIKDNRSSSLLASTSEEPGESRRARFPVWPEWNEAEVNSEKWDGSKGSRDGKTGKSPSLHLFEDPEGKVQLPGNLKVSSWRRPLDFITAKSPVVVEDEFAFDLMSASEHLLCSELVRQIISEIYIVWKVCGVATEDKSASLEPGCHAWKPWEHIYSLCKAAKEHMPLYNPHGKYVVRLFWMGCWRKITVDDFLPFDEESNLLLPATAVQVELWPMLLAKAIMKLANTEVGLGQGRETADFSVVHALTGWLPEFIPLQARYQNKVWHFLTEAIPESRQVTTPDEEPSPGESARRQSSMQSDRKSEPRMANEGLDSTEACMQAQVPQMVVCASYQTRYLLEKTSVLGQMADSSENLRQHGLSQLHSHTVLVTRTRACPLITPPKPPPIPRWKLVRPRKETVPTDEPKETPLLKPSQFIEISSPFLNRVTAIPSPELDRQTSSHGRHSCSSTLASFTELEETEDQDLPDTGGADTSGTVEVKAEDQSREEPAGSAERPGVHFTTSVHPNLEETKGTNPLATESPAGATLQETWIGLDSFFTCFQTLLVFHKPDTYPYRYQTSHFKDGVACKPSSTNVSMASAHAVPFKQQTASLGASCVQSADDKGILFLLVDSLLPSEILISFSSLVHWGETPEERTPSQPGLLLARPISWKTLQSQLPVLNIQTTSTKAALLSLPPGRHVLRLSIQAPLGYHVFLCSTAPFTCGDEDVIVAHLDKDSLRFREQAAVILRALSAAVNAFNDEREHPAAMKELMSTCSPPLLRGARSCKHHVKVFGNAVFHMVTVAVNRKLNAKEVFAVQALLKDPSAGTDVQEHTTSPGAEVPESWRNREATEKETAAASILQAGWKGLHVREVMRASRPGTEENVRASKTLREIWASVESDMEKHAASLLRHVLSHGGKMAELYPCYEDESSRVLFTDYLVAVPDHPAHSWGLVFREVFLVPSHVLLHPKVFSPFPTCVLHIIDNDSGDEVPRVFQEVEPRIYKPNQRGYTFVAEAHFGDVSTPRGKWKMRLIRSCDPPPKLSRHTPLNTFAIKEFRDSYIPNDRNIICRFSVKVTRDHMGTVQFQMSEPDVSVKLTVLDHEEEVASCTGRVHAIIPIFCFLPSNHPKSPPGGHSGRLVTALEEAASGQPLTADDQPSQPMSHKYVIQAEVLHKRSLEQTKAALQEKNGVKVAVEKQEEQGVLTGTGALSGEGQKASTPRSTRRTRDKERDKAASKTASKQETQVQEVKRPQWTLRFVSDQSEADVVQVRKDTEREDEIKAMKKAWEAVEPGRSIKAKQVRLHFINKHLSQGVAEGTLDKEPAQAGAPDVLLSPSSTDPGQLTQKDPQQHPSHVTMSITPPTGPDVLSNSWKPIAEKQRKAKAEHVQSFRLVRDIVLDHRRQEKQTRKMLKWQQLEVYEGLQMLQNEWRQKTLMAREGYWSQQQEAGLIQKDAELPMTQQTELGKGTPSAQPLPVSTKRSKSAKSKK